MSQALARWTSPVWLAFFVLVLGCGDGLLAPDVGPRAMPASVVFRGLVPGEAAEATVTLLRFGDQGAFIRSLRLRGDDAYSLVRVEPPAGAAPGFLATVIVRFRAPDAQPRSALLQVTGGGRRDWFLAVPLTFSPPRARVAVSDCVRYLDRIDGGAFCATPTDDLIVDFGDVRLGECRAAELAIENRGDAVLRVEGRLVRGSSRAITIDPALLTAFEVAAPGATHAGEPARRTFAVSLCPGDARVEAAQIALTTNDPEHAEVVVNLRGTILQ